MASKLTIFIFGILNFSLLLAFLARGLRKLSREFFFSRRMHLSKEVSESKQLFAEAQLAFDRANNSISELAHEIQIRKEAMYSRCKDECNAENDGADKRCEIIINGAKRQAEAWRKGVFKNVRRKILIRAFSITENDIKNLMNASTRTKVIDKRLHEFSERLKI